MPMDGAKKSSEAAATHASRAPRAHVTSTVLIFELLDRLRARGIADSRIEAEVEVELPPPRTIDPDVRWPLASFAALANMAIRELEDPALGVHIAEELPMERQHAAFRIGITSPTLRAATESWARYASLVSSADRFVSEDRGARARNCYMPDPAAPQVPLLHEHYMVLVKRAMDTMFGDQRDVLADRYGFAIPAPPYLSELERVFGHEIELNARFTYVEVNQAALDMPLPRPDPYLRALLRDAVERRLTSIDPAPSTARSVLELLAEKPLEEQPVRAQYAEALGLTDKTLQRRLEQEGITFRVLVDRHRRQRAEEWIREGRSAAEIAYWLGFSETAAFTRAFRRWTGTTVASYRRKVR